MRAIAVFLAACLLAVAVASCVQVTTARRAETVARTEEGEEARRSEVVVRTWGWDLLGGLLKALFFPFKVLGKAVDAIT
ncbi:MAG: hypothetical protein PHN82_01620 [bacterium]|nr:hypothetical protein [bacterium]